MSSVSRWTSRSAVPLLTTVLLLTLLVGFISTEPSSAAVVVVNGDWTVTGTGNVYDGVIFKVDGNITIESGGVLEIRNGGLSFLQDSNHIYYLEIRDGGSGHGSLILDNSVLTTEPNQLSDYLKLNVTVAGTLIVRNNSMVKHPGSIVTSGDARVEVRSSVVTGFTPEEIASYTLLNEDDNDDAPVLSFAGTSTILVADSVIYRLYENPDDPGPDSRYNITLQDSAILTIINSYVGVDFHTNAAMHNTIAAGGSSRVYIYNMTLDQAQSSLVSQDQWIPALGLRGTTQTLSLTAYPTAIGEKDTTGEPLSDINADDGVYYTAADGERLYLESFGANGNWRLVSAILNVQYWTDAGWNGTSAIRYALEGETLQDLIIITDTGGVGGITTTTANLTAVQTWADARFLDVDFINDDGAGSGVHFDYISIAVTYEQVNSQAEIYVHRWIDVTVKDRFGSPVPGAYVESRVLPSGLLAYYPQNGGANVPDSEVLGYMGATAGNFNVTDARGVADVPLLTEWINRSSFDPTMPNSFFIGNYRIRSSFQGQTFSEDFSFSAYPDMRGSSNRVSRTATLSDLVWPAQDTMYTWGSDATLDFDVVLDGSLTITADITVSGADLVILQGDPVIGRHYLIIEGEGSLTIADGRLASNFPLVVYLRNNARFTASNTQVLLSTDLGRGMLYSQDAANVTIDGGLVWSDVTIRGWGASFKGVTFARGDILIDAASTSYLWDPQFDVSETGPVFPEGVNLTLASDDGSPATVDFDIRNVTFNETMSGSILFTGTQYFQLTNVTFEVAGDWWTGRIFDQAKASSYQWLRVRSVDSTGTPVLKTNITLLRMNPQTLVFGAIPVPGPDDLYMGTWAPPHIEAPSGAIIYRALSHERLATRGWSNSTYRANGSKIVDSVTFYADRNETVSAYFGASVDLVFSNLTPALSMVGLSFSGGNGVSNTQPEDILLTIRASVSNDARVDAVGVNVHYYSTDVDLNQDGVMDATPDAFASFLLGQVNATIDELTVYEAYLPWTPANVGTYTITVVVDPWNVTYEVNESNNLVKASLEIVSWPDLSVQTSDISLSRTPVEDGEVNVVAVIRNSGPVAAVDATVELYDNTSLVSTTVVTVGAGSSSTATLPWTSAPAGFHTLRVKVITKNDTASNRDYNFSNNNALLVTEVLTKPDLELKASDYNTTRAIEGRSFTVHVVVYNVGNTTASGFGVGLYQNNVTPENLLAVKENLTILAGRNASFDLEITTFLAAGNHTLILVADPTGVLPEVREDNNQVEFVLEIVPPQGQVFITSPMLGQNFNLGETILVTGSVNTPTGQPIPNMRLTVLLVDQQGNFYSPRTVFTDTEGRFTAPLLIPADAPSGQWTIQASAEAGTIQAAFLSVNIARSVPWYEMTIPGVNLPLWMLMVIFAIFLLVAFAIAGYMKTVGIGRLVECGECGAFIHESATTCPKCGTEFEREMAKCSSCHAWIPMDVKRCPECGVEFTSGKARGTDYRERMRKQYEKVVDKYRAEAAKALGRRPSEKEFQEWWRRQPTYVTFESWLKEEEEMRKMGSKPCSICGALNALTASVCHKCGTLMSSDTSRTRPGQPPSPPPQGAPPARQKPGEKPIFKKILKKPFTKRVKEK